MDWESEASWIWIEDWDDRVDPGQFALFRRTFTLDKVPEGPCNIKVSADTRYRCFVNGKSVSFGPCKSYPSKWHFEEVDITSHLVVGTNVISAKVLRFSSSHAGSFSLARTGMPGLFIHCVIGDKNLSTSPEWKGKRDKAISLVTRSQWNYAFGPPFLSLSEKVDGSLLDLDWTSPTYDDGSWSKTIKNSVKSMMLPILEPWNLNERPIPMLPEIETKFHSALKVSSGTVESWNDLVSSNKAMEIPANSTVEVDIKTEILTTGFLQLACTSSAGAIIQIICAESYERDMSTGLPRCKTDTADYVNGTLYGPEDTYTTHSGSNYYEPFWFRTFRFLRFKITTTSEPLTITSLSYRSTHYPLIHSTAITFPTNAQSPPSSSADIPSIWDISLNTLKNCMHETYEDCPYYEQNQFTMDTRLMLLFTYQLSRDDRLARKSIAEFADSQQPGGLLQTNAPVAVRTVCIPQFSLYWILMVEDHYTYFKAPKLVKTYLGTIDKILEYFDDTVDSRGLVGRFPGGNNVWPFIDWVPQWMGPGGLKNMAIPNAYKVHGAAAYNSLIYAIALQSASKLCAAVGRHDTSREYLDRAAELNAAVNEHCWDGSLYLDGPGVRDSPGVKDRCQHTQIFAILSGAIAGKAAASLLRRTFQTPNLPKASFAMLFYAFRAASLTGLYDELFQEMMTPWSDMLRDNLTTCRESSVLHRSDCHGWSASPIYEVVGEILGVRPSGVKGGRVTIEPRTGLMTAGFEGSVVLGEGRLTVGWNEEGLVSLEADTDVEVDVILGGKTETVSLKKAKVQTFGAGSKSSSCIVG